MFIIVFIVWLAIVSFSACIDSSLCSVCAWVWSLEFGFICSYICANLSAHTIFFLASFTQWSVLFFEMFVFQPVIGLLMIKKALQSSYFIQTVRFDFWVSMKLHIFCVKEINNNNKIFNSLWCISMGFWSDRHFWCIFQPKLTSFITHNK